MPVTQSVLVVEMSPIIGAKAFSFDLQCFSDLAVIIYHEVMQLASGYDRVGAVFDRYCDGSLKEGTRSDRGNWREIPVSRRQYSYSKRYVRVFHEIQR